MIDRTYRICTIHRGLWTSAVKQSNCQADWGVLAKAFRFNMILYERQRGAAEWESVYLDQLLSNSFFQLSRQIKSTTNLEDQETTSSSL